MDVVVEDAVSVVVAGVADGAVVVVAEVGVIVVVVVVVVVEETPWGDVVAVVGSFAAMDKWGSKLEEVVNTGPLKTTQINTK